MILKEELIFEIFNLIKAKIMLIVKKVERKLINIMEVINKNEKVPYRQLDKDLLRIILVVLVVIGHGTYYDIITKFGGINYGILMSDASISDTMFHKNYKYYNKLYIHISYASVYSIIWKSIFIKKEY